MLVENLEKPKVFFLEFIMKFQKYLGFLNVFGSNSKKNLGYFWNSSQFQKKNEFSKIPKNSSISPNIFGILENPRFFFGIVVENLEKPKVFWNLL